MREINIGDKTIRVRVTPLTLLYYKQAFNTDVIGDLMKMQDIEKDPSKFDAVIVLQLLWAMAKTDVGPGKQFPTFERWVSDLEYFDVSDQGLLTAILEEAMDGFFRRGKQHQQKQGK